MTDTVNEQLSACLDGKLPDAELDLLLRRVARNQELGRTLGRYALTGEALRGAGAVQASASFADRVSAAIAAEEVAVPQRVTRITPSVMRWLRPAAGFAVAAGVATVAVLSLQTTTTTPEPAMVAQAPPAASVPANDSYIVPANTVSNFVPATRLTNYVVAHSEYSSPLGMRTVLSGVLSEEDEAGATEPDDESAASASAASSQSALESPRP